MSLAAYYSGVMATAVCVNNEVSRVYGSVFNSLSLYNTSILLLTSYNSKSNLSNCDYRDARYSDFITDSTELLYVYTNEIVI